MRISSLTWLLERMSDLKKVGIIYRKELVSYLASPMAYIVAAVFMILSGAFFIFYLVGMDYTDTSLRGYIEMAPYLIFLFAAVLTMRMIAEEKKQGTWEFLFTSPVRDSEIIYGKFFACLTILVGMLVLSLYFLLMLCIYGDPDIGPVITSYIGLILLGATSISIGIFASCLTSSQIASVVLSGGFLFGLWFLGSASSLLPEAAGKILASLSLSTYLPDFARGVLDTRGIVYYLSMTALFLYLSVCRIEVERWR